MGGGSGKAFCEAKPLERGGAATKNLSYYLKILTVYD
jgi:hypothetical protein